MSRVTTKVTDLESLKRAKKELSTHLEVKRVNIQIELNALRENLLPTGDNYNEESIASSKYTSKMLSRIIVKNFIKPKSKILSKASIFIGSFIIDKYGGNLQQTVAKWLIKKDQALIDE